MSAVSALNSKSFNTQVYNFGALNSDGVETTSWNEICNEVLLF